MRSVYALFMLSLCVWREARSQDRRGKIAVAWVIRNRAERPGWWGGPDIPSVITKPRQFSCFNADDPQVTKWPAQDSGDWRECQEVADAVLTGAVPDPTSGADHYYATWMDEKKVAPSWAEDMEPLVTIGDHKFFRSK